MHEEKYIQASEINAFVYCPMQWYYRFILNINIKDENMKIGNQKHNNHWLKTIKRKEQFFICDTIKIKGKVDYLIEENGLQIPMEIKKGKYYPHKEYDVMQLITYIKLMESFYKFKYSYGYILYMESRKKIKVTITKKDRSTWKSYVNSIRSYKHSKKIPKPNVDKNKCINCSLSELCAI